MLDAPSRMTPAYRRADATVEAAIGYRLTGLVIVGVLCLGLAAAGYHP